jgi:AcrR family transcriptional regulator
VISTTGRGARADATRESILAAAERLFAERGVVAVSNRQVSEAAGQGNNAAVGYHFGTKADLVRAIVRKHTGPTERLRVRMLAEIGEAAGVRDWVACLVRPAAAHLAELGSPTWYARFGAQVMTDPALQSIMQDESFSASSLREIVAGLNRCLPELPAPVRGERDDMARQLIVHVFAERERALADGTPTPRATWQDAATGLVTAIVAVYLAPA